MIEILKQQEIAQLSFEEAISKLEKTVESLESGQENLENSINLYVFGEALKKHSEKKLSEAKLKVEKILSVKENGEPQTEEFLES